MDPSGIHCTPRQVEILTNAGAAEAMNFRSTKVECSARSFYRNTTVIATEIVDFSTDYIELLVVWLAVSTPLKNISQLG